MLFNAFSERASVWNKNESINEWTNGETHFERKKLKWTKETGQPVTDKIGHFHGVFQLTLIMTRSVTAALCL